MEESSEKTPTGGYCEIANEIKRYVTTEDDRADEILEAVQKKITEDERNNKPATLEKAQQLEALWAAYKSKNVAELETIATNIGASVPSPPKSEDPTIDRLAQSGTGMQLSLGEQIWKFFAKTIPSVFRTMAFAIASVVLGGDEPKPPPTNESSEVDNPPIEDEYGRNSLLDKNLNEDVSIDNPTFGQTFKEPNAVKYEIDPKRDNPGTLTVLGDKDALNADNASNHRPGGPG